MYKILSAPAGRWGEGYQVGDIVDFDFDAARVAIENREIEPVGSLSNEKEKDEIKKEVVNEIEGNDICAICGKVCKSRIGLASHLRTHQNG